MFLLAPIVVGTPHRWRGGGASRSVVGTATAKDILVMAVGGDWRDARAGVRSGRTDNLLQRWNVYGSAWT